MAAASPASDSKRLKERRISSDTWCSSNTSCVLQKRKPLHPLASGLRSRTSSNPITQRILSAKRLQFKSLQNKLNDANYHISQLSAENKLLKSIQKRQDQALSRYEGSSASLPQILESHQEELRVLQSKNKELRRKVAELTDRIKIKDDELNLLKDENRHLLALCKNKNLEEREKLTEKVESLEEKLRESEKTINLLNRKVLLESKNHKFTLNYETSKQKKAQDELNKAVAQINSLKSRLKVNERASNTKIPKLESLESKRYPAATSSSKAISPVTKKNTNRKSESPKVEPKYTRNNSDHNVDQEDSSGSERDHVAGESDSTNYLALPRVLDKDTDSSSEMQLKEMVEQWQKNKNSKEQNSDLDSENDDFNEYFDDIVSSPGSSKSSRSKNKKKFSPNFENNHNMYDKEFSDKFNNMKLSDEDDTTMMDYKKLLTNKSCKYSFEEDLMNENISSRTNSKCDITLHEKNELLEKLNSEDTGNHIMISEFKKSKNGVMKELFG